MYNATLSYDHAPGLRRFLANVFAVMAIGLAITGAITLWISHSPGLMEALFSVSRGEDGKSHIGASMWWWSAAIVEIVMVFILSKRLVSGEISVGGGLLSFVVYSALNGVTLAPVIYAYTDASVAQVFFITAGTFSACALFGRMTNINLLPMRSFFLVGLVGLLIALVANLFIGSSTMNLAISATAVLLFAGLTAYDVQKLRELYMGSADKSVPSLVILGALTFYLDFINLFIHLLNLVGVRKD